ncbi:hypothetical protein FXO38_30742 [Capsicum annuum]|nr:hypothetical protein FXO38_30742 [Capsicum annuum]
MFYVTWDTPPESKQRRRLQLASELWSDPLNTQNVSEGAEVVAKLDGFREIRGTCFSSILFPPVKKDMARLESEIKLITFVVANSTLIFSSMKMNLNVDFVSYLPVQLLDNIHGGGLLPTKLKVSESSFQAKSYEHFSEVASQLHVSARRSSSQEITCLPPRWAAQRRAYLSDHNVKEILLSLLRSTKSDSFDMNDEAELANMLQKSLKGKRYLIVLDDMWKTEAWDVVRLCFPSENKGSGILLTTRNIEVAHDAGTENLSLHMDLMGPDESWNLFKSVAFANEALPSEFETIGKKIAEKCHGLPLTILVVAGLGFECAVRLKSTGTCQGGWGSSQYGSFNFLWPFGWTNKRNGVNGAFSGQICVLLPAVLGVVQGSKRAVG